MKSRVDVAARLLVVLGIAPLAMLVLVVVRALAGGDREVVVRAVERLGSSVAVSSAIAAAIAGLLSATLGLGAGWFLASRSRPRVALALLYPALCVPAVFLGGVLSDVTGLGPAPGPPGGPAWLRHGALIVAWSFAYAPLAGLAGFAALGTIPRAEWNAARLSLGLRARVRILLAPRLSPPFALIAAAVAALAFHDVATPAHFGVETLASLIAFDFQATLDVAGSAAAALPSWMIASLVLARLVLQAPSVRTTTPPRYEPRLLAAASYAAVVVIAAMLPAAWAVHRAGTRIIAEATRLAPELLHSARLAAIVAVVAALVVAGAIGARVLAPTARGREDAPSLVVRALAVLPFAAPGIVVGLFGVGLDQTLGIGSSVAWWFAFLARVVPWAWIGWILVHSTSADRAAQAVGTPAPARLLHAWIGPRGTPILIGALAASAAALREIELFAVFSLPGEETLAARAAQGLHYGLGPDVATAMLLQIGAAALVAATGVAVLSRRPRPPLENTKARPGPAEPLSFGVVQRSRGPVVRASRLTLCDVTKTIDAFRLGPIDLQLPPAATTALLGPSGSGKSTLLDLIAGLERPDAGTIDSPRASYLMQDLGLWDHRSARENVASVAGSNERANALLAGVRFRGDREAPAGLLSGGERQRVAMARALALDVPLLLLDEPGAHLDRAGRDDLASFLASLCMQQDGTAASAVRRTVVVATHELDEALRFAPEHLVLLEGGRVLAAGPTSELCRRPRTRAVAERVGFVSFLPVVSFDGGWTCAFGRMTAPGEGDLAAWRPGGIRAVEPDAPVAGDVVEELWTPLGHALRVRIDPMTTLVVPARKPRAIGARVGLEWDDPVVVWDRPAPARTEMTIET